jgi:hypothetical protein
VASAGTEPVAAKLGGQGQGEQARAGEFLPRVGLPLVEQLAGEARDLLLAVRQAEVHRHHLSPFSNKIRTCYIFA